MHIANIYTALDRGMFLLQLCSWKFSHKETLHQSLFDLNLFLFTKTMNLLLSHPLGKLGVTYALHLQVFGKHVVDFLLAIIELFFASSYS